MFGLVYKRCLAFKQNNTPKAKTKITDNQEVKLTKPDSSYAQLLKLSVREFKIFMINTIKARVGKVNSMNEQMENYNPETEIIKKSNGSARKFSKNMVTGKKNIFDGLIHRFDKTKEINSKLEDNSIEITQTKTQKEKRVKQRNKRLQELWDSMKRSDMHIIRIHKEKEKVYRTEETLKIK